jgi:fatty acid desaturase
VGSATANNTLSNYLFFFFFFLPPIPSSLFYLFLLNVPHVFPFSDMHRGFDVSKNGIADGSHAALEIEIKLVGITLISI